MKAAVIKWNGGTVTNAGIYLTHLGKLKDATVQCFAGPDHTCPRLQPKLVLGLWLVQAARSRRLERDQ